MTITIHPGPGETLTDITRAVFALAGDTRTVRSGRGGIVVDDHTALAFLTQRVGVRTPAASRPVATVPMDAVIEQAERAAGIRRESIPTGLSAPEPAAPPPARRTRKASKEPQR